MLKKLTAILTIMMILVLPISAVSATDTAKTTLDKANDLHNMDLYAGTNPDPTKFTPDLGAALTREQGIALMLRLMGLESAALAVTDAEVTTALAGFSDKGSVSDWAKKYVGYAVKNNIIVGFPDKTLKAKAQLTGNEYSTMLLKGAGYSVTADTFAKATAAFAAKVGITTASSFLSMGSSPILRSHAVDMSFGQLGVTVSGQTVTVVQDLVARSVVTAQSATAAGFSATASSTSPTNTTTSSSTSTRYSGSSGSTLPTITVTGLNNVLTAGGGITRIPFGFTPDTATIAVTNSNDSVLTNVAVQGTDSTKNLVFTAVNEGTSTVTLTFTAPGYVSLTKSIAITVDKTPPSVSQSANCTVASAVYAPQIVFSEFLKSTGKSTVENYIISRLKIAQAGDLSFSWATDTPKITINYTGVAYFDTDVKACLTDMAGNNSEPATLVKIAPPITSIALFKDIDNRVRISHCDYTGATSYGIRLVSQRQYSVAYGAPKPPDLAAFANMAEANDIAIPFTQGWIQVYALAADGSVIAFYEKDSSTP